MNTYTRLFLAGSIGAITGGSLTHYLIHGNGFTGFLTLLLGIMAGAFTASAIFDPKGTKNAGREALKNTRPFLGTFAKETLSAIKELGNMMLKVLILLTCSAVPFAMWYVLWRNFGGRGQSLSVPMTNSEKILSDAFLSVLLTIFPMAFGNIAIFKYYEGKSSFGSWLRVSAKSALFVANPIAIGWQIIRLAFWLVCKIPAMIKGLILFVLFLTIGLTKCRARTSAMTGACLGTISGFFWWNPLIVGTIGGTVSVGAHFVAQHFGAWAERAYTEIKSAWTEKNKSTET